MTPPSSQTPTGGPDKFAQLEEKFSKQEARLEKLDAVANQIAELSKVVNANLLKSTTKEIPVDPIDPLWKDFDPDAKKAVETTVDIRTKSLKDELLQEVRNTQSIEKQKEKYDGQALKEYPQLLDERSEFRQEYNRLLAQKQAEDPEYINRPSAVYETAMVTFASLVRKGKIVPREFNEEARRLIAIGDSQGLGIFPASTQSQDDLTDSQAFWSNKLKVSKERYLRQLRGK